MEQPRGIEQASMYEGGDDDLCIHALFILQRLHCLPCIRGISICGNELLKTDKKKEEYCTVQSHESNVAIAMLPYQQNITVVTIT